MSCSFSLSREATSARATGATTPTPSDLAAGRFQSHRPPHASPLIPSLEDPRERLCFSLSDVDDGDNIVDSRSDRRNGVSSLSMSHAPGTTPVPIRDEDEEGGRTADCDRTASSKHADAPQGVHRDGWEDSSFSWSLDEAPPASLISPSTTSRRRARCSDGAAYSANNEPFEWNFEAAVHSARVPQLWAEPPLFGVFPLRPIYFTTARAAHFFVTRAALVVLVALIAETFFDKIIARQMFPHYFHGHVDGLGVPREFKYRDQDYFRHLERTSPGWHRKVVVKHHVAVATSTGAPLHPTIANLVDGENVCSAAELTDSQPPLYATPLTELRGAPPLGEPRHTDGDVEERPKGSPSRSVSPTETALEVPQCIGMRIGTATASAVYMQHGTIVPVRTHANSFILSRFPEAQRTKRFKRHAFDAYAVPARSMSLVQTVATLRKLALDQQRQAQGGGGGATQDDGGKPMWVVVVVPAPVAFAGAFTGAEVDPSDARAIHAVRLPPHLHAHKLRSVAEASKKRKSDAPRTAPNGGSGSASATIALGSGLDFVGAPPAPVALDTSAQRDREPHGPAGVNRTPTSASEPQPPATVDVEQRASPSEIQVSGLQVSTSIEKPLPQLLAEHRAQQQHHHAFCHGPPRVSAYELQRAVLAAGMHLREIVFEPVALYRAYSKTFRYLDDEEQLLVVDLGANYLTLSLIMYGNHTNRATRVHHGVAGDDYDAAILEVLAKKYVAFKRENGLLPSDETADVLAQIADDLRLAGISDDEDLDEDDVNDENDGEIPPWAAELNEAELHELATAAELAKMEVGIIGDVPDCGMTEVPRYVNVSFDVPASAMANASSTAASAGSPITFETTLTIAEFRAATAALTGRLLDHIREFMDDTHLSHREVRGLILAGGGAYLRAMREVRAAFPWLVEATASGVRPEFAAAVGAMHRCIEQSAAWVDGGLAE